MTDSIKVFTDSLPTEDEFLGLWTENAKANGADVSKLLKSQVDGLASTAKQFVRAVGGDEREQRRLDALLALGQFNAEAEAFLELDAWTKALLTTLKELAGSLLEAGAKALVAGLASSLQGGLGIG